MNKIRLQLQGVVAALAVAIITVFVAADARAVEFSGKTIELVVPSKEGSGTDRYARIFQPFLEKHLPGNPTVILVSKPGGSGIKGSNWFERKAKRDGTTIIATGGSIPVGYVFAGDQVKFDLLGWNPIVLSPFGICYQARKETGVTGTDGVADIKALRKADRLRMGAKNRTSSELQAFMSYALLGIKNVRPVFGLSSGKRRQAISRGELEMGQDASLKCKKVSKNLAKNGVYIYMTAGFAQPDGSIVRDPMFPDAPHVGELYEALNGKKPSGPEWASVKHLLNMVVMSNKALWLPKGTPDDVIKAYDTAVKKIYKDKKFKKLTKKTFGNYPQSFGKSAKQVVKQGTDIPADTKKWMVNWIKKNMGG